MNPNLFSLLSKWAVHSGENFCTDALAWTLAADSTALRVFLESCHRSCDPKNLTARSSIAALARSTSAKVITQKRVVLQENPRRYIQPDLWIEDEPAGICLLVEIKVWASATMRRRSSDIEDDEDTLVPQAADYRRWLERHRHPNFALIALTVDPDTRLSADCDGSFRWDQLHASLREDRSNPMTQHFCEYLEDAKMVTEQFNLGERELVAGYGALNAPHWDALRALIDRVAETASVELKAKLMGKRHLSMEPSPDGLFLWSRWLRLNGPTGALWITPYLRLRTHSHGTALEFSVGLAGAVDLKSVVAISPDAEENQGEISVPIALEAATFEGDTLTQAQKLVRAARSGLLDRLLGV